MRRAGQPPALARQGLGKNDRPDRVPIILKGVMTAEEAKFGRAGWSGGDRRFQPWRPRAGHTPGNSRGPARDRFCCKGQAKNFCGRWVRSGWTFLKMLALGAEACSWGGPWQWLAVGGKRRRALLLRQYAEELRNGYALRGMRVFDCY